MGLFDFFKKKKNEEENISEVLNEEGLNKEISEEEPSVEAVDENAETEQAIEETEEVFETEEIAEPVFEKTAEMEVSAEENEETTEEITEEIPSDKTETAEETVEEEQPENAEENSDDEENSLEEETEETADEEEKPKKGFFARLKEGLGKTRKNILGSVDSVLGAFTKIDEDLFEELEEALIMADLGVQTTMDICDTLRKRVKREGVTDPSMIKHMLSEEISEILLEGCEEEFVMPEHTVLLVIGVNGVGKTTTIGKLASSFKSQGKSVLLAAADTFRAAAIDQLAIWGDRCGVDVIKHEENSDPAAVVFDAANAAKNRKTDILICDTAGRLHNKKNLMEELKKISKVIEREYPQAHKEVFLVLDATTGQNALQQAKLFKEAADITGIILTKLDGTAKGGIVVAIKSELKIPVRYIGVGEGIDDLQKFDAKSFAEALFDNEG